MKKIVLLLLCVFSQMAALQAFDVEARVAYFLPQDSRMRDVYGKHGWADYEIEASAPLNLCCDCSCDWDVWFNTTYFHKKGNSTCLSNRTTVDNWAFNFGIKRYFDMCTCFRPYLGFGAGFAHVKFHDKSPYVKQHIDRWGWTLLAKSGIRYDVSCNIFLDLFLDYAYNRFDSKHHRGVQVRSVNTGGLKVGLGLGYQF